MVLNLKERCLEDWKCGEEKMDWDNYTKSCMSYSPFNSYSDNAVWDVVFALWAVQLGLRNRVGTIRARFQWFLNLTLVWLPITRVQSSKRVGHQILQGHAIIFRRFWPKTVSGKKPFDCVIFPLNKIQCPGAGRQHGVRFFLQHGY